MPEMFKLFKSCVPSVQYVFKNGKLAHFRDGRYATKIQSEIDELTETCEQGHPTFFIDNGEEETAREVLDPLDELRQKFFKEFQENAAGKVVDPGNSDQSAGEGAGIATSATATLAAKLSNSLKK
jgi:hypothetical protein